MNTLVIGVGNEYRGDDAIGLIVARRIHALALPQVRVIESDGEGTRLMESWQGAERVILIDAVCSDTTPGTIHRFAAHEEKLPAKLFATSTHAFGVAEAIELSQTLGHLPPRLIVLGLEGRNFGLGALLSIQVASVVEDFLQLVLPEIAS